jgi:peptide/nickel transport system permease protein
LLRQIGTRLIAAVPVMFVVMALVFILTEAMPGDTAAIVAGEQATPQVIEASRHQLGLDLPLPERFLHFVTSVARGDLGKSFYTRRPVLLEIQQALPATASLALVAMLFSVVTGMLGGIVAALRSGHAIDRLISASAAVGLAVPPFVFGFMLVVPLAVNASLFPATGYVGPDQGVPLWLYFLVLPGLALGLHLAAEIARQVRGSMVDTLAQDFIRTARANGLSRMAVVMKHALRNAAIPVVVVIGLQVGRLLGGTVVVEQVFGIPGFGSLAFTSVSRRDLPLIQGVVLVTALIVITLNLIVDMSYAWLNPRLRSR